MAMDERDSIRGGSGGRHRRCRGTAEVELILVAPVLLTVLLLCAMAARLGEARQVNVRDAEQEAYRKVMRGEEVVVSSEIAPAAIAARPGLPLRFAEARPTVSPKLTEGWLKLKGVTVADKAVFLDPTWPMASWPYAGDSPEANDMRQWYLSYIEEAHSWDVQYGLGLAEPWKP